MAAVRIAVNDESLKGPLTWSLMAHVLLIAGLTVSTLVSHRGEGWGGPGAGAVSVTLVGGLAGVPLPRPETVTTSRVVDESKGLYTSQPVPKPPPPPPDAKELPAFTKDKPQRIVSNPSRILENDAAPPPNAVPYGRGGAPSVPYAEFSLGGDGATSAGMGFTGSGGGGDFGSRFSWYVDAVRNRVSSNWLQSRIDSSIRFAPRAVVTFDILRSGAIANVQVLRSSGNSSVDSSAMSAILGSNPVQALPNEYSGNKVSVEFWFDFKR